MLCIVLGVAVFAGCGSDSSGSGSTSTAASGGSTTTTAAATTCGEVVNQFAKVPNNDPDNVMSSLSPRTQDLYNSWATPVAATPWKDFKGIKGPWKIGLVMFPLGSAYNQHIVDEAKKEFAQAKAKGLVSGSLVTYIQPSYATATPEQQIAAIQQMVRSGVNGILLLPLAGEPLAPAIDAAGKAGVPVVAMDNVIANSKYVVNIFSNKQNPAAAKTAAMVKDGNVLVVRGLAGNSVEKPIQDVTESVLKSCPGLKQVGEVYGNWAGPAAKTAVQKYLAAHPGQQLDMVLQNGAMMSGIVDAFQSAGRPVPKINDSGCQGGDLSWWLEHKDTYNTVGTCNNGYQVTYTAMRFLFRVLAGKGLKLRDVAVPTPEVTNANLSQFATPGLPLTSGAEAKGPIDARCGSDACMNGYFDQPGTPDNF